MIKLKNENDIAVLRESGSILAETFQEIKKYIEPGISTIDIDAIAEKLHKKQKSKSCIQRIYGIPCKYMYFCK